MGGFKPKSLDDELVVNYSKAKSEGKGFDSLDKKGPKTNTRSSEAERKKKIKSIKTARLNEEQKTLLGG